MVKRIVGLLTALLFTAAHAATVYSNFSPGGDLAGAGSTWNSQVIANLAITNAKIAAATINLTTKVTGILPTANGGTGIAYFTAAGPTAARVYTFPDAATTIVGTDTTQTLTNKSIVATQLTGSIADARLSANVPLKDGANTWTANQTMTGSMIMNLGSGLYTNTTAVLMGVAGSGDAIVAPTISGTTVTAIAYGNATTNPTNTFLGSGIVQLNGAFRAPNLATSSAATTGTMCWTTGTGNVNVDTTVACLASTRKVKQNIQPLDIGLTQVLQLRPVSYDLRPEFNPYNLGPQVGLVAEEVADVDDRLIARDDDGDPRGVRYMQLTAVLVKSIQEQQVQIEVLTQRVVQLEARH